MKNATAMKTGIAIGNRAMANGTVSRDNIAIGDDTLINVQGETADYDQSKPAGTRNIAIGGNSSRSVTTGRSHVAIGRNSAQNIVGGQGVVAIGAGAQASSMPTGLTGEIENWAPVASDTDVETGITAVGWSALGRNSALNNTAIGAAALSLNTSSQFNVAVGDSAMRWLDNDTFVNGLPQTTVNIAGTYNQTGKVLTLTIPNHGLAVNDIALLRLTSGVSQTLQGDQAPAYVTVVNDASNFAVNHPIARTGTGTAELRGVVKAGATAANNRNTAVGSEAMRLARKANRSTMIGWRAGYWLHESESNTVVGANALAGGSSTGKLDVEFNAAFGADALLRVENGAKMNTAVGAYALNQLTTGTHNTSLGYLAGSYKVDGTPMTAYKETTALGAYSRTTGDYQVQLGSAEATPYSFAPLQTRSDARDKSSVRDTVHGLDFINALRPVDFKYKPRGGEERERFHHGVIAQDVADLIESTGVDFGGYQDHKVNGGDDVLTVSYSEFIAPMIKAIQELTARVVELEGK